MFLYFTNWSLMATTATCLLGTLISQNKDYTLKTAPNLFALHHLMYTLMLFMTPVVLLIYWGLVHEANIRDILSENTPQLAEWKIQHSYVSHSVPAICALILLLINDTILVKRHCYFLICFGTAYAVSNYFSVKSRGGKPLYWFMTWEDYKSPMIAAEIIAFFVSLFYVTAIFDSWVTNKIHKKKSKLSQHPKQS